LRKSCGNKNKRGYPKLRLSLRKPGPIKNFTVLPGFQKNNNRKLRVFNDRSSARVGNKTSKTPDVQKKLKRGQRGSRKTILGKTPPPLQAQRGVTRHSILNCKPQDPRRKGGGTRQSPQNGGLGHRGGASTNLRGGNIRNGKPGRKEKKKPTVQRKGPESTNRKKKEF